MKKILPSSYYFFDPSSNRIDFTNFPSFEFNKLMAIINVTQGRLIYTTAGHDSGLDGNYSAPNLYFSYNVSGMSFSDDLQVIYQVNSDSISASDGSEILSSVDVLTGKNGLDFNLLNSSFGGELGNPIPAPYTNNALSVGFNNGGTLKAPAMNYYDQLKVEIASSATIPTTVGGTVSTDLASFNGGNTLSSTQPLPATPTNPSTGSYTSFGVGASDANTQRTASNIYFNGTTISTQAGATDAGTQRVVANINTFTDINFSSSGLSTVGTNLISGTSAATDVSGYRSFTCSITSTATGGTYIFEQSNDNTNFVALPVVNASLISGTAINGAVTASATTIVYSAPIMTRYIRCRIATALTGGTASATTKIAPFPFVPTVQGVGQATAANLIVRAEQPTAANFNCTALVAGATLSSATVTDITSAAITTTQTSGNITTLNTQAASWLVTVSALSGTNTSMDVVIQETMDAANYYTIYAFERITTTGQYFSPCIKLSGSGYRIIRTISGTTPSITNGVVRISRAGQAETVRRFIDRTIDPNTLNSTTASYLCEGVEDFNLIVRCTAQTTPATIALEFSMDNTNWFTTASTLSTVTGISQAKTSNEQWKFVRAKVTASGSGITLDNLVIGGHSA